MRPAAQQDAPPSGPPYETGNLIDGKYRVVTVIGSGGMGVVLLARDLRTNERVAIKVLKLRPDVDRASAIARFQREARAMARIDSEHVLRVTDVGALDGGIPYLVMEYLEGDDLGVILDERSPLPIDEATGYLLQACEGVAAAHAAGVVHRDLKPSNLFLARHPDGSAIVKVLDFGVSKLTPRPGDALLSTTNMLLGTPIYMAPEQLRSARRVDGRADIWSLGVVLYELLTRARPFEGETIPEVCIAVMKRDPRPISLFRTDVPEELQTILQRCLAKVASQRFPTATALAAALGKFAPASARPLAHRARARGRVSPLPMQLQLADTIPLPAPPDHGCDEASQGGIIVERTTTRPRGTLLSPKKTRWERARPRWLWPAGAVASVAIAMVLGSMGVPRSPDPNVVGAVPLLATTVTVPPHAPEPASTAKDQVPMTSPRSADPVPLVAGSTTRGPSATELAPTAPTARPAPSASLNTSKKSRGTWKWGERE
ncbi:MAG TPA: protein kinase [Polyangiaceae bacterium]